MLRSPIFCGLLVLAALVVLFASFGCRFAGKRAADGAVVARDLKGNDDCFSLSADEFEVEWSETPYISEGRLFLSGKAAETTIIHDSRAVVAMEGDAEQFMAAFVLLESGPLGTPVGVARIWHPSLEGNVMWGSAENLYPLPEDYRIDGNQFAVEVQLSAGLVELKDLHIMVVEEFGEGTEPEFVGYSCILRK